jgi:large subunit ribosomal protein L21
MFAVIRTGGKQYRVAPNDIIEIEKVAGEPGEIVELGEVLLLGGEGDPKTGSPISGATVAAEVIEQKRADKIIVFKKKRRKGYRRTKGHRQALTALRITEILTDGKKPSKAAAKKAGAKTETKAADKADAKKAEAKPAEAKPAKKAPAKKAAAKKTEAKTQAKPDAQPKKKAAPKKAAKAPAKKAPKKKS